MSEIITGTQMIVISEVKPLDDYKLLVFPLITKKTSNFQPVKLCNPIIISPLKLKVA